MNHTQPQRGDLRVWWIPNVPGTPWHYYVDSIDQGALLLDALADYDAFLLAKGHRADYSNVGGLEIFESETLEWEEWETSDGRDITEVLREMHEE